MTDYATVAHAITGGATRTLLIVAGCVALWLVSGCSDSVRRRDARDGRDPLMRKAAEKQREGDNDYAIELYRKVLDLEPKTARASLDLAILLHDAKADYVSALYHYGRYLELRPQTEKRELIENRMRLARQAFAAANLPKTADTASALELEKIKKNNNELRDRIRHLEGEQAELKQRLAEHGKASAGTDRPRADARVHRVRPGETLTQIAQRHDVAVADLVRINHLKDANAIYAGQVLKISDP